MSIDAENVCLMVNSAKLSYFWMFYFDSGWAFHNGNNDVFVRENVILKLYETSVVDLYIGIILVMNIVFLNFIN